MAAIIQWVRNLIFIILFTALLEMFLPESNMRKYIRVVMGFFIITILLSPLTAIFHQDFTTLQSIIPKPVASDNWHRIEEEGAKLNASNQMLLKDYYKERIVNKISEVVKLSKQDYQEEISVSLNNDYMIEDIKLVLRKNEVKNIEISSIEIDINNSNISNNQEETSSEIENQDKVILRDLKYNISQIFQISTDKIEIILIKGG